MPHVITKITIISLDTNKWTTASPFTNVNVITIILTNAFLHAGLSAAILNPIFSPKFLSSSNYLFHYRSQFLRLFIDIQNIIYFAHRSVFDRKCYNFCLTFRISIHFGNWGSNQDFIDRPFRECMNEIVLVRMWRIGFLIEKHFTIKSGHTFWLSRCFKCRRKSFLCL